MGSCSHPELWRSHNERVLELNFFILQMNPVRIQLSDTYCFVPYCTIEGWGIVEQKAKNSSLDFLNLSQWNCFQFECFFRSLTGSVNTKYRTLPHYEKMELLLVLFNMWEYINPLCNFGLIADHLETELALPHPLYDKLTMSPYPGGGTYILFYEKANILDCLERYKH